MERTEVVKKVKPKKWPVINEESAKFQKLANNLARQYVQIDQCRKCWHPCVHGYCCNNCGDGNPYWTVEQEAAWEKKYAKK